MSKYKAQWKDGELNRDFWNEVFVRRVIKAMTIRSISQSFVKMDGNALLSFPFELELDSGEVVWLHRNTEFPDVTMLTGQTIKNLVFGNSCVEAIKLDRGEIKLYLAAGNFCIRD